MGTRHLVVGALCAVLLLSGCAQGSPSPGPGADMSTSPSEGPAPSELSLPPSASAKPANMTLTGLVEAGVENGCLIMRSGGTLYLLVGGDRDIVRAGARVRVTGRLAPDLKSYCMQGTPFQVSGASPA